MTTAAGAQGGWVGVAGSLGRVTLSLPRLAANMTGLIGALWLLFTQAVYFSTIAPLRGRSRLRKQLFPMMNNVGTRSLPIVALIAVLIGAILVLQTGDVMQDFGQIQEMPGLVALSMTRALGPLMTAIVLIARVCASYTAVLGSMNINDEITALRTMSIDPIGYLVAPRFISMIVMLPCLVVFAYVVGMSGGCLVSWGRYGIPIHAYVEKTFDYLAMADVLGGLLKSMVFAALISVISCHYGLTTSGGPVGLGRNIMVSVVTCLVIVVFADAVLTALLINYIL